MAANSAASHQAEKRLQFRPVNFDIDNIAPDAPAGEWKVSIPRGKCKVQPTKEDHYPMLIVAVRLDGTDEEGEDHQKALGTELSSMIVFFGDEKARAARMSKIRLRQLCEAADVDLDIIPKVLKDPVNDLEPLIHALEGKKFTAWTKHTTRKDTGEVTSELVFANPSAPMRAAGDDDEPGDDDDRPANGKGGKGKGGKAARR